MRAGLGSWCAGVCSEPGREPQPPPGGRAGRGRGGPRCTTSGQSASVHVSLFSLYKLHMYILV